jgi:hypothetical protein
LQSTDEYKLGPIQHSWLYRLQKSEAEKGNEESEKGKKGKKKELPSQVVVLLFK